MKKALTTHNKRKQLLFLGDSLIEYFNWADRFPGYDVYNLGIAGETVQGLSGRLDGIFRKVQETDMVFIMSGINSMAMGDEGIADMYRTIVQKIKQAYPSAGVVVQSLLPVLFPYIENAEILHMNTRLKQMAADEKVLYLDIHSRFLDEKGMPVPAFLMDDGVHVSGEGYRVWSDEIGKFLG